MRSAAGRSVMPVAGGQHVAAPARLPWRSGTKALWRPALTAVKDRASWSRSSRRAARLANARKRLNKLALKHARPPERPPGATVDDESGFASVHGQTPWRDWWAHQDSNLGPAD